MHKRKNLVFIMTDHQRADSIHMVQDKKEVTPNLNQLALEATHFESAYTTCPICVPARTALATGLFPTETGVVYNDWSGDTANPNKTIHQYLYENGYDLAHIGVDHIKANPSFTQLKEKEQINFKKWVDKNTYRNYCKEKGISPQNYNQELFRKPVSEFTEKENINKNYTSAHTGLWEGNADDFMDAYYCREAISFINEKREKPFALFLYLWAPHPPLVVPEPFASMFDPEKIDLPQNVGTIPTSEPPQRRNGIAAQLGVGHSNSEWRKTWAAHLGLVHLADRGIGQVLNAITENQLDEKTATFFTADHGDHLGQRNMYQKMEMYEPALRIPLIVKLPEGKKQRCSTPVSHLDIMPTILDTCQCEYKDSYSGKSLVEMVMSGADLNRNEVFSQYSGASYQGDIRRAIITNQYKYIYDPRDRAELYDLNNDPLEMQNLIDDEAYQSIINKLHLRLKQWCLEHRDFISFN